MKMLLDSHYYPVLYYNAVIWLTPSLSPDLKQNLLSISANAMRNCVMHHILDVSFENVHNLNRKCTLNRYWLNYWHNLENKWSKRFYV